MAKEVNCPDYEKAEDGIESDAEFLVGKKIIISPKFQILMESSTFEMLSNHIPQK
jgi:hypothetical protein